MGETSALVFITIAALVGAAGIIKFVNAFDISVNIFFAGVN